MKISFAVGLSAYLLAMPANAASDQFDLLCSGKAITTTSVGAKSENFEKHLRLDLASGKYCEADCRGVFDLLKVNPATIVISDGILDAGWQIVAYSTYIDRVSGEYIGREDTTRAGSGRSSRTVETKAVCELRPFSGFNVPDAKF